MKTESSVVLVSMVGDGKSQLRLSELLRGPVSAFSSYLKWFLVFLVPFLK